MGRFAGKSIIVTGAGSGIGRASARLFAQEGGQVIAADISEAVEETVAMIRAAGGVASDIRMDAGNEGDVQRTVALALSAHGGLDVIYANAGISGGGQPSGLFDASVESWAEVLRVNLIAPWLMLKHGGQHIVERGGGAVVCTASVAGLRSGAGPMSYSASKAGVINLVQTAAQYLVGTNVRVNAICPGLIETGMTQMAYDYARATGKEDRLGQLNPLQRGGEADEIARTALFLASDDASYINGQAIVVDGGLSSSLPTTRRRIEDVPAVAAHMKG